MLKAIVGACLKDFKTLEAMDSSLMSMVTVNDYHAADYFTDDSKPPKSPHEHMKKVSDRFQAEEYYFEVSDEQGSCQLYSNILGYAKYYK